MQLATFYNWYQADVFLKQGCKLVSIGFNEETKKIKFIFLRDEVFEDTLRKWQNRTL